MYKGLRLLRTVIHLRPRQVVFQVLRRFQGRWSRPPANDCIVPDAERFRLGSPLTGLPSYAPVPGQSPDDLVQGEFSFLNDTRRLGKPFDWTVPDAPLLWRYNLHYFDWLWSLDLNDDRHWEFARDAIIDWVQRLPPAAVTVGWAPYPTSLRLINWSMLLLGRWRERVTRDAELTAGLVGSMWRQLNWLARRLEFHLLANHLLENAVALTVAAACFTGRDAQRWHNRVAQLLARELDEQLLPDGCHYERSPMYHARVVWLLDVLAAAGIKLPTNRSIHSLRDGAQQALELLRHPDGQIALLNDAAQGIYRLPDSDTASCAHRVWALPDAGYYGARTDRGEYLVVDAGPVGPDYQPGHAHADLLSFEWSLDGRRVVTDTGVFEYQTGPNRQYDRSTAAHNTVSIGNRDSCEVWGGFRVGRRVRPVLIEWQPGTDRFQLSAEHAGFSGWIHRRRFDWSPGRLELVDTVVGRRSGVAVARLHLTPEATIQRTGANQVLVTIGAVQVNVIFEGKGTLSIDHGWYSPEFGIRIARSVLAYRVEAKREASWTTRLERSGQGRRGGFGRGMEGQRNNTEEVVGRGMDGQGNNTEEGFGRGMDGQGNERDGRTVGRWVGRTVGFPPLGWGG